MAIEDEVFCDVRGHPARTRKQLVQDPPGRRGIPGDSGQSHARYFHGTLRIGDKNKRKTEPVKKDPETGAKHGFSAWGVGEPDARSEVFVVPGDDVLKPRFEIPAESVIDSQTAGHAP